MNFNASIDSITILNERLGLDEGLIDSFYARIRTVNWYLLATLDKLKK